MNRNMFVRVAIAAVLAIALSATRASAALGDCAPSGDPTFDATAYCPYGYAKKQSDPPLTSAATVANCCQRATDIVSFPECTAASSGGSGAVQAITADDSSWLVQDGNGFTRTVGKYTGMCFNIKIDTSDCNSADTKCCTSKPPMFLQFKVPSATTIDATCKLSYGTAVANANSVKRVAKWIEVGSDANAAKFFNVPITWKKGSKTGTACLYSLADVSDGCKLENVCGVGATPTVPDANGSYDAGCELRVVGRKGAASSACCAPTFSIMSFDSSVENRLAGGAPASEKIELHGV